MTSKWQVNMALRRSSLPPPSRHIMLLFSDLADPKTAVVPDERTPSLNELAEWTGYDRSTVTRHLDLLDEKGWLHRDRPDRIVARRDGVRTKYRLMVPRGAECTTGDEAEQAEDGDPVVQSAPQRDAQDTTPRGAENATSVVHTAPRPVVHSAPDSYTDEVETIKNPSTSKPKKEPKANLNRPDVERMCNHLADRVEALGIKRPTIGVEWRTAARLLIDDDKRTEDQVIRAIDWALSHHFWHRNVHSMKTLRKQYDRLRLDAEAERRQANGRASPQREQLTEVNGLMLGERNQEALARNERMRRLQEAKNAGQPLSIEGQAA